MFRTAESAGEPLRSHRHRLDLVKEQSASASQRDDPRLRLACIGKRATDVPEQFAFDERFGKRATIYRNERRAFPRTQVMDGTSSQFLAGSRLTLNKDHMVARRKFLDQR
jgi:hypothetical protein